MGKQNDKQKKVLPGGESNPGLPRDRRDTHHYTTEDFRTRLSYIFLYYFIIVLFSPVSLSSSQMQDIT